MKRLVGAAFALLTLALGGSASAAVVQVPSAGYSALYEIEMPSGFVTGLHLRTQIGWIYKYPTQTPPGYVVFTAGDHDDTSCAGIVCAGQTGYGRITFSLYSSGQPGSSALLSITNRSTPNYDNCDAAPASYEQCGQLIYSYAPNLFGLSSDATITLVRLSAVPEPSGWAMMIIGFGAVGSMVRTSRRRNVFSAT